MKIYYEKPDNLLIYQWENDGKTIWYSSITTLGKEYCNLDLPNELILFLDKWNDKMLEYKKVYKEKYPVKMAKIDFVYKDVIYRIIPSSLSCTYLSDFLSDEYYEVEWDSLLEFYHDDIINDLKVCLGVSFVRYTGYLD